MFKKANAGDSIQFYSLGLNRTVLIAGLGNPGQKYAGTRHNIGCDCLDEFAAKSDFPAWVLKKNLKATVAVNTLGQTRVILIKPTTFMNLSGEAVLATASFYKIPAENICLVHDELDVPFGQIRTRVGGSAAGHNGVKSVISTIGENTNRVRLGIGPKTAETNLPAGRQVDSADFVLQKFSASEQKNLAALKKEAAAIISEYAFSAQPIPADTRSFLI
ncbi:MAG: aminoacyl-tRNA hydrolase [Candidatus Saccharimonadales bacterium]